MPMGEGCKCTQGLGFGQADSKIFVAAAFEDAKYPENSQSRFPFRNTRAYWKFRS